MALPYSTPKGGTRVPAPKPAPKLGPAPMSTWRQPTGGVRSTSSRAR